VQRSGRRTRAPSAAARAAIRVSRELARAVDALEFGPPITHVYDPLVYAREPHERYLALAMRRGIEVLFLGMNPGPFGMAQTGVPFGDAVLVREWLGIEGRVRRPEREHPKRPVRGLDCPRREVSGKRFWSWARARFGEPRRFFERFSAWNYCPLLFLEESGRNRTPDALPAREAAPLFAACDRALAALVRVLEPELVVGVGSFAAARARSVLGQRGPRIGTILHPSPASPRANRGWARAAERELAGLAVELPRGQ
jgi:single-strand selective monofunctional uracil DNA glycosylase